ncbi:MAG TPA: 4Fe-4S dicluster domain-containing protein [Candidatus Desulfofervidus auxilii]|uniref:4Fe-4S dicluster domain-containing protein n=1 Tax=Desulfofervidus auxilii TaxID=1621989 RepID=A0A7C0Y5C4_DESA2|nr:4Fe-4S dicluster domain-containing protein [Candidatus Desulfofervidus auxilii]
MKELVIISGKGGTGKTTLTAAFAALAKDKVIADTDVDAPDLHLILSPQIKHEEPFKGSHYAIIDKEKCIQCGECRKLCRFHAINEEFEINPIDCEGCGVCVHFCPQEAINFPQRTCGKWFISETRFGPMVHAQLDIGQENSGLLATLVRQQAKIIAEDRGYDLIIVDGPPGVGCPVIASVTGASVVMIVTEPSPSGLHDLERVWQLAFKHFGIPCLACINKFDLNPTFSEKIETFCKKNQITLVGKIPFDPKVTEAVVQAKTVIEIKASVTSLVAQMWEKIYKHLYE